MANTQCSCVLINNGSYFSFRFCKSSVSLNTDSLLMLLSLHLRTTFLLKENFWLFFRPVWELGPPTLVLRCCLAELPLGWAAALLMRVLQQLEAGSSASSLTCEQPRHKPGPSAAMESLGVFTQFVLPCPSLNSFYEAPRLALSSPASGEGSAKPLLGREDRPFPQPHGERTHPSCLRPLSVPPRLQLPARPAPGRCAARRER